MCVRDRVGGERERGREENERQGGMLTGEAVQRAEREAGRCTAHGKQQVRRRKSKRGKGSRERRSV